MTDSLAHREAYCSCHIDLIDCRGDYIQSEQRIESWVNQAVHTLGLNSYGQCVVLYFCETSSSPGYTFVQICTDGIISGHFDVEVRTGHIDILSHTDVDMDELLEVTKNHFRAGRVIVNRLRRIQ